MNIIGIITEYNPFHNGHLYQIKKIKKLYPNSIIIIAMSSHYTERGELSVLSKWDKTKIALENNIDIIIEIPLVFTNQSADTFSYAALTLLNELKIDTLVFGSETNDINTLKELAKTQINNKEFDELVKKYMDKGYNFPTSISKSLHTLTGKTVKESNDILGVSYIKEITKNNYPITPITIKRTNNFLDTKSNNAIISALNIREKHKNNIDITPYIPKNTLKYIKKINYEKFYQLLRYKILSEKNNLKNYHLIDEGLENRIYESAKSSQTYSEFIEKTKSKRITYNKLNRILINIYLGFTKKDNEKLNKITYIRILGMSKKGKEYYTSIKKEINLPIYFKFKKNETLSFELTGTIMYSMLLDDEKLIEEETKNHVILK